MAKQDESSTESLGTKWLIAVVPAVLTGLFVLAPSIWERFAAPKVLLEYKYQSSGDVVEGNKHVSMVIIDVRNSGTQRLTNVDVFVSGDGQKISEIGLVPRLLKFSGHAAIDGYRISIDAMLPGEKASITALSEGPNVAKYDVKVRSDETFGSYLQESQGSRFGYIFGFSVVCALVIFGIQLRSNYVSHKKWEEEKEAYRLRIVDSEQVWFKPNIIIYVAGLCGLPEIIRIVWDAEGSMEFFGAADFIFGQANATNLEPFRTRSADALIGILVVPQVQGHTEKSIISMLKHLESRISIEEIKAIVAES